MGAKLFHVGRQTDGRIDRINSDYFHKEFTFMLKTQRVLCVV